MSTSIVQHLEQQSVANVVLLTPVHVECVDRVAQLQGIPATRWSTATMPSAMEKDAHLDADLVVIAPSEPGSAPLLVRAFRGQWRQRLVPLLVLCPTIREQLAAGAYAAGADFVATPEVPWDVLRARVGGILRLRTLVSVLMDSRDRAKSRIEQHERWSRFLVHDMRNPLMALTSGLGSFRESMDLNLEDQAYYDQLSHELTRLSCLVSDLLDHERLVTGVLRPERAPTDLGVLLERLMGRNDRVAAGRGIMLRFTRTSGSAEVTADSKLIERVVENVISNALRHSPRGDAVDVELAVSGGAAQIAVLNGGTVIPVEMRETIFDPYVQLSGPEQPGASGLGLAFCREVMRAHGGSIRVVDRDQRTCFLVELPRAG